MRADLITFSPTGNPQLDQELSIFRDQLCEELPHGVASPLRIFDPTAPGTWYAELAVSGSSFILNGPGANELLLGTSSYLGPGAFESIGIGNEATVEDNASHAIAMGYQAYAGGPDCVAIGDNARAGQDVIAIGDRAWGYDDGAGSTSTAYNVAIGRSADVRHCQYCVAIGGFDAEVSYDGIGSLALGSFTRATQYTGGSYVGKDGTNYSIALGYDAHTGDHRVMAVSQVENVFFGADYGRHYYEIGYYTPAGLVTLQSYARVGNNKAGADFRIAPGRGTGSAAGGHLYFGYVPAGAAGGTENPVVNAWKIDGATGELSSPIGASIAGYVPTTRTLTAGIGLVGGGDLSANRTFDLDITELTEEATIAAGDYLAIYDVSAGGHRKMTRANLVAGLASSSHTHAFTDITPVATDRLLGRDTAGSGACEEITVGGGLEFTGSGGIQRSALTGDVTASAGSGSTTIANGVVTYAKMQNVSTTDRVLGRSTAGAGDVEEIVCTAFARSLLDDGDAATARGTLGAAASSHTHTSADITDFGEAVEDRVDTLMQAGTGTAWTYSDAGNTGQVDLDIPSLTAETTIADTDLVAIYDVSAAAHRKMTKANFVAGIGGITGSGAANRAAFWSGASALDYDDDFTWDDTNKRLGIGTTSPSKRAHFVSTSEQLRLGYDDSSYYDFQVSSGQVLSLESSNSIAELVLQGTGANASIELIAGASHTLSLYADTFNFYTWAGAPAALTVNLKPSIGKLVIVGSATGVTAQSWIDFQDDAGTSSGYIGDTGSSRGLQIGTAAGVYTTVFSNRFQFMDSAGTANCSVICTYGANLATTATDGFLYIPCCNGTPTGVPTAFTGSVALVYDIANNKLYVYNSGWKTTTVFA